MIFWTARQVTARKEAANFQKNADERKRHQDTENARIRNEDKLAFEEESALERNNSSDNAKRMMKGKGTKTKKKKIMGEKEKKELYLCVHVICYYFVFECVCFSWLS